MAVAEIVSIGTELLLGQIVDTNSQFLGAELATLGIDCYFRSTVGDNKTRIKNALRQALNRSDIVITTGGLGPTADDLTTECIAELFDAPLVLDDNTVKRIEEFFRGRDLVMPESNKKQALRPQGADILPNPRGTAPGIIWHVSNALLNKANIGDPARERVILTFPGVPSEMKAMWIETAAPHLMKTVSRSTLWSCELKHYGIGESALAEKYAHLLELKNPTVAPYAGTGECRLRVTARGKTVEEAKQIAEPVVQEIISGSGTLCYGRDDDTLESRVGALLSLQNKTISLAESCTGGLVSKRLTDIAGSSKYIKLNLVTYANEAKEKMLGVSPEVLNTVGAVSAECAEQMASGAKRVGNADIGIGITGIAGPDGGSPEKPVGLVFVGIADRSVVEHHKFQYPAHWSRADIRFRTASDTLNMIRLRLIAES